MPPQRWGYRWGGLPVPVPASERGSVADERAREPAPRTPVFMRTCGARHAVFWGSTGVLAYLYVGFPLVVAVRGLLRQRYIASGGEPPPVTVVIPVFNEAGIILEKLENTLSLDYPADRVEVVVASDGSTDATNDLVERFGRGVQLLALPRIGKNRALSEAAAVATG